MAPQVRISSGQLSAILLNTLIIVNVLTPATVVTARRDAWLGALVLNVGQHLVLLLTFALINRFPGMSLVQVCRTLLGRLGGTVLASIYMFLYFYNAAAVLRVLADFLIGSIMPDTPIVVILITMGLLVAYGVRQGIENLGRFSQVVLPVVTGWLLLVVLLVAKDLRMERLLPTLENGFTPLLGSFLYAPVQFAETPFLLTLAAMVSDRRALRGRLHAMLLLTLALNLVLSVAVVTFQGINSAETANYPVFTLTRGIDVADFIQRIEALFMGVIVLGYFLRAAVNLYAAHFTLAEILGLADPRPLVLPLVPLLVAQATLVAADQQDYKRIFIPVVLLPLTWVTGVLVPLILLLIGSLRRALGPRRTGEECSPP